MGKHHVLFAVRYGRIARLAAKMEILILTVTKRPPAHARS